MPDMKSPKEWSAPKLTEAFDSDVGFGEGIDNEGYRDAPAIAVAPAVQPLAMERKGV